MKYCDKCGGANDDDSRFCVSCGQLIEDGAPAGDAAFAPGTAQPTAAFPEAPYDGGSYGDPFQAPVGDYGDFGGYAQGAAAPFPAPMPASGDLGDLESGIAGLAQAQAENADRLRATDEKVDALADRLAGLESSIDRLAQLFDDKIARNEHEATALKQVSAEVEEYRNGLYEKLTMPFVRDVIAARSGLQALIARHEAEGSVPVAEAAVFGEMLADTLAKNSVEIVASEVGDEFLSFKHKLVGKVPTADESLHGRIAEVEGESYRLGDTYLAPALVKVYTLESAPGAE